MKPSFSALGNLPFRSLPDKLATLFRSGARRDLLAGVDLSLVLYEQRLVNSASGEYRELPASGEISRAAAIARAARALQHGGKELPRILLLLPPSDFVATHFEMAISGESLIRSALQLQAHTLLPGYDDPLLLAAEARRNQGVALWYPAGRADALFEAFREEGLFLSAIMPRSLALAPPAASAGPVLLHDEDSQHLSLLQVEGGAIRQFRSVSKRDLEQEAFAQQWEEASAELQGEETFIADRLDDWTALRERIPARPAYCFLPSGSLQRSRTLEQGRRRQVGLRVALGAVLLLCIPFLANWLQIMGLERRLADYREESAPTRELRDAVFAMEEEWGAVADYPQQNVAQVLLTLNQAIQNSLRTFDLDKGNLRISGFSQDPGALVAQLARREEFINVSSGNISGGNSSARGYSFDIQMGLRSANFGEYERQYPLVND